jgi:hypothetical protein
MDIYLGRASPRGSSGLPEAHKEASNLLPVFRLIWPLLDLAPDGGCLAASIAAGAGGLLHHLFTLTPGGAVCFCGPVQQVDPPEGFPAPGITRRPALRSADFPQPRKTGLRPSGQPGTLS